MQLSEFMCGEHFSNDSLIKHLSRGDHRFNYMTMQLVNLILGKISCSYVKLVRFYLFLFPKHKLVSFIFVFHQKLARIN